MTKKLLVLAFVGAMAFAASAQTLNYIGKNVGRNAPKVGPVAPKIATASEGGITTTVGTNAPKVGPNAPKFKRFENYAIATGGGLTTTVGVNAPKVGPNAPKLKRLNSVQSLDLTQKYGPHAPLTTGSKVGRK